MVRQLSLVWILWWFHGSSFAQTVTIDWEKVQGVNKTVPSLQIMVNPALRPRLSVAEKAYAEVRRLGANYVRYQPWIPFPKLSVAELEPPADGKTSWDFSLLDPMVEEFLKATAGHPVIVDFSTTPQWMWVTRKPVPYPRDPNEVTWTYTQGTELRDPSGKELADYYGRLASWYVNGGFTDEYGKRHESGHHFDIPYWEVLNEPDFFSHIMSPEEYTRCYDSIVSAIKRTWEGLVPDSSPTRAQRKIRDFVQLSVATILAYYCTRAKKSEAGLTYANTHTFCSVRRQVLLLSRA